MGFIGSFTCKALDEAGLRYGWTLEIKWCRQVSLNSAFLCSSLILQAGSPYKVAKIATSLQLSNLAKPMERVCFTHLLEVSKKDVVDNIGESSFSRVIGTERLRVKLDE